MAPLSSELYLIGNLHLFCRNETALSISRTGHGTHRNPLTAVGPVNLLLGATEGTRNTTPDPPQDCQSSLRLLG